MSNPETRGVVEQQIIDPGQVRLAHEFEQRLDQVSELLDQWERIDRARVGARSELAADDRVSAWRQLSHTVGGAMSLAADNLRALERMVRRDGKLLMPQFAHYSLLRSALEGSSLALWILHPSAPEKRVERLLRAAAAELRDDDSLAKQTIKALADDQDQPFSSRDLDRARKENVRRHRKHAVQIGEVAARFGLADPCKQDWTVGYAEIVREATAATGLKGYYGETTWRIISGLCHPSLMRATARSNIEELADNGDGTFHALISSDLGLSRVGLEAAFVNMSAAVRLLGERKIRPADMSRYPSD